MRRSKGPKTSKTLREHVRRRAEERFGLLLTTDEIDGLAKAVQNQTAQFYDRQSINVTRWIVPLRGKDIAVCYDKKRKAVRTVLPVEYLQTSRFEQLLDDLGLVEKEE